MTERRKSPRRKTHSVAWVAFDGECAAVTCLNLSETGACLELASTVGIPDAFDLVFDGGETARACQVIWWSKKQIGVRFPTSDDIALTALPGEDRQFSQNDLNRSGDSSM
jgi:PilZ domain